MPSPKRYHPLLVVLHWLSALLVLFMLAAGMLSLKWMDNEPAKFAPLAVHMLTGIAILVLTAVRLVTRLLSRKPAPASSGSRLLDFTAGAVHVLLYAGLFGMGISGLGLAALSGILPLLGGAAVDLPITFFDYAPRYGHGYLATALALLAGLHIAAALYHQFIRKDGLIGRMGFGRK
ncbi:MAG: cytochrome b [Chloroflexi bacterium]|nr:cytochrome b [Chloroflexota bacterium]